ncbi:MAG: serine hydrolase domain-containing protein [Bacteroidota bacterium]
MKYVALLLLFLPITALVAQEDAPYFFSKGEGEDRYYSLSERMEQHRVPGASTAIFRNFELDTTFQLGYRDTDGRLPVTPGTIFQMGSMTGAVVKFAVVSLASRGKIDLDKPANQYLGEWQIEEKGFTKRNPITVRDLLLEARGFNDVYKPKGYRPGLELPTWEEIMAGDSPSNIPALNLRRNSPKGSSLANEMILQRLLEEVYQADFPTLMKKEVFDPLGMKNSLIAAELNDSQKEYAAAGHQENGESIEGKRWIYPELAHSGLWSTPEDFGRFILFVYQAAQGKENSLLSQELALAGIKAQRGNTALILLEGNNNNYWGGAPQGFYSQFSANFEGGWIVVGCSNRQLAWQFVNWDLNPRSTEYAKRP